VLFPKYSAYFKIASDLYATVAVTSLFMLSSAFIGPTLHEVKNYFRTINPKPWQNNWPLMVGWLAKCTGGQERGVFRKPRSGLTWFNVSGSI
jgi:hypothetical protein